MRLKRVLTQELMKASTRLGPQNTEFKIAALTLNPEHQWSSYFFNFI
jgi:hypothetical protein